MPLQGYQTGGLFKYLRNFFLPQPIIYKEGIVMVSATKNQVSVTKTPAGRAYDDCQLMISNYSYTALKESSNAKESSFYLDPELRFGEAPRIVDEMMIRATLTEIAEDQRVLLEESVAVALQLGLAEEEILETADSFSWSIGNQDQFAMGMPTIIALQTAQRLHRKNISEEGNGIQKDFDSMVESVSNAMIEGYITFRYQDYTKTMGLGIYQTRENVMYYDVSEFESTPLKLQSILIHEARHAYQDMKGEKMNGIVSESEAYGASAGFDFLTVGVVEEFGPFSSTRIAYQPIRENDSDYQKDYTNTLNNLYSYWDRTDAEIYDSYADWYQHTIMAMFEDSEQSSNNLFAKLYIRSLVDASNDIHKNAKRREVEELFGRRTCANISFDVAKDTSFLHRQRDKMHEACEWSGMEAYEKNKYRCWQAAQKYMKDFNSILFLHLYGALKCGTLNEFNEFLEENADRYYGEDLDFVTEIYHTVHIGKYVVNDGL